MNLDSQSIFLLPHPTQRKLARRNSFGMKGQQLAAGKDGQGGRIFRIYGVSFKNNGHREPRREDEIMRQINVLIIYSTGLKPAFRNFR